MQFYLCYRGPMGRPIVEVFNDPDAVVSRYEAIYPANRGEFYLFCSENGQRAIHDGECPDMYDYVLVRTRNPMTWELVSRTEGARRLRASEDGLVAFHVDTSDV